MKHAKLPGLLAVAAMALMAFAGSASATTLTSVTGTSVLGNGSVIAAAAEAPHTKLDGTVMLTCENATVSGSITSAHGASGVVVTIDTLTFTDCGKNTVTVVDDASGHNGTLRINSSSEVFSSGAEVTALTHNILGTVHCIYRTSNTDVGNLTDTHDTGGTATLDINGAGIPEVPTDTFACKDDAVWTGNYKVTTPDTLYVD